jgi:hypothetical protein
MYEKGNFDGCVCVFVCRLYVCMCVCVCVCVCMCVYLGHKAWVDIKRRLYMPTYYGRGDHSFKIKLRQQRNRCWEIFFFK